MKMVMVRPAAPASSFLVAVSVVVFSLAGQSVAFTTTSYTRGGSTNHVPTKQSQPCTSRDISSFGISSSSFRKSVNTNINICRTTHSSSLYNKKIGNDDYGDISKRNNRRMRKKTMLPPTEFDDYYNEAMSDEGNATPKILESIYRFLVQPVPIPLLDNLPLVYPLALLLSAAIIPPVTCGLLVLFFGVYLSLGNSVLGDANDGYYDNTLLSDDESENQDVNGVIPLASFTGALASSALISPQGLVLSSEDQSSFTLTSTIGIVALGLAGITILVGIQGMDKDEQRWKEREVQESIMRNGKKRMDQFDYTLLKDGMPDDIIDKNE